MNVNAAMPAAAGQETTVASIEQNLFDHAAAGLDGGSAKTGGTRLANPSAMVDSMVGGLEGFLDRSRYFSEVVKSSTFWSSANELDGPQGQSGAVASSSAQAAQGGEGGAVEGAGPVRGLQFQRTIDLMLDSMRFHVETNLVSRGAAQISSSTNTLIKGQ